MSEAGVSNVADPNAPRRGLSFVDRLVGVLRLDGAAYEEIGADPAAMGQAVAVVAIAAVGRAISAIGGPLSWQGFVFFVMTFVLWPAISVLAWAVGGWFGHSASLPRVLRLVGFAVAPIGLAALGVVPVEALKIAAVFLSTALWIATTVVAVRTAIQATLGIAGLVTLVAGLILFFAGLVFEYLRQ